MLGHRLIRDKSVLQPSSCINCDEPISWFDLIPLVSFALLRGNCRRCTQPISWLYPCIELLTVVLLIAALWLLPHHYFPAYFIFLSALIVTVRSDIEAMLISRYVTLFLIPAGVALSWAGRLPISFTQSVWGATISFSGLYLVIWLFKKITGKDGMGMGDVDLLAFIGAFTGLVGAWLSLLIGSVAGSIVGIAIMLMRKEATSIKIPFGPCLALGAVCAIFFKARLLELLF